MINRIALILLVGLSVAGCKRDGFIDKLTQFHFDADYLIKVPATPVTNVPVEIITPDIATHSDALFTANKTRADLVERVKLTELTLSVKTPVGGNLNFLKSVDVYARAEGLPEVRIAYKDAVPANVGATLSLDVADVDLVEYFKKDKYQLRIVVTGDEVVTEDYGVNAHSVFFVDAKILGQ